VLYLEFARRTRHWSQKRLSVAARLDQRFLSDIEIGRAWPTPEQRGRLAAVLGVSPDVLLTDVVVDPTSQAVTR
jgi:transcriptional regulator with XRE-family HTH domain